MGERGNISSFEQRKKYENWRSAERMTDGVHALQLQQQRAGQIDRETFLLASDLLGKQEKRKREKVIFDLTNNEGLDSEFLFSREWLAREVKKESQKSIPEGKIPWYILAGAGFHVGREVERMMDKGDLETKLAYAKLNIEHFENEYLKQMTMLKYNLAWGEVNGEKRIICPDINGATWASVTAKDEREGAVYEALFGNPKTGKKGVEAELKEAPPGSFVFILSPKGWSNLKDPEGNAISFPESQGYAIKKEKDGSIQARTFRYQATHEQDEKLLASLGHPVEKTYGNLKERIKGILKNTALIRGDDNEAKVKSFEDIVDKIQQAVGGREEAYQGQTFTDIKAFLADPNRFLRPHPLTEKIVNRLSLFIRWEFAQDHSQDVREKNLKIAYGITMTSLNRLYREKEEQESIAKRKDKFAKKTVDVNMLTSLLIHESRRGMDYQDEYENLRKRPGCAGGGQVSVLSMGGMRTGEIGVGSSKAESKWYSCPDCGFQANGPIGNVQVCPGGCGFTKAESIKRYGKACA